LSSIARSPGISIAHYFNQAPSWINVDNSQTPPTGFFDPLGFSTSLTPIEFKKYREAELKHGRLAMLAVLGVLIAENFHPLFDGKVTGAAIYHFQQIESLYTPFWYFFLIGVGVVEAQTILRGTSIIKKY
jgi:hypothetical protein